MLAIRMQRTGRKGHATFRVVVQDTRQTPTSGKVVASLGNYDPHTKAVSISKEKAEAFLSFGAQPSERVARLLKEQGVKLPTWAEASKKKTSAIRHPEKLRRNRPDEPKVAAPEPADEPAPETEAPAVNEAPADETTEALETADAVEPAEVEVAAEEAPEAEAPTKEAPLDTEETA